MFCDWLLMQVWHWWNCASIDSRKNNVQHNLCVHKQNCNLACSIYISRAQLDKNQLGNASLDKQWYEHRHYKLTIGKQQIKRRGGKKKQQGNPSRNAFSSSCFLLIHWCLYCRIDSILTDKWVLNLSSITDVLIFLRYRWKKNGMNVSSFKILR